MYQAGYLAIATVWGLSTTDKALMQTLYEIGGKAGGLRALTRYLRLAAMAAKGNNQALTLDLILSTQQQMQRTV